MIAAPAAAAGRAEISAHLDDPDQDQAVQKALGELAEPALRRCASIWHAPAGAKEVVVDLLLDLRASDDSRIIEVEAVELGSRGSADEALQACLREWLTGQSGTVGSTLVDYDGRARTIKPLAPGARMRLELPFSVPLGERR